MESKEEIIPDLMKQNISKENIMKLFVALCKHKKEYDEYVEEYPEDFDWSKCKECVLSKIVHYVPHGFKEDGVIKRDVCFAIWHDHEIDTMTRKKKPKRPTLIVRTRESQEAIEILRAKGKRQCDAESSFKQDMENRKALARISVELQDNQR